MEERPPRPSLGLLATVVAGGAGLGLIATGITSGPHWILMIPGFALVILALPLIYLLQRP